MQIYGEMQIVYENCIFCFRAMIFSMLGTECASILPSRAQQTNLAFKQEWMDGSESTNLSCYVLLRSSSTLP